MIKLWIPVFLLSAVSLAQYSANDKELARITFNRTFNDSLILTYLNSNELQKVNAGLLSVSHSSNTSFIKEITKLKFSISPQLISFALGQLGASDNAANYLLNNFIDQQFFIEAVGKTGNISHLNILKEKSSDISPAVYHFYQRGILDKDSSIEMLNNQLKKNYTPYGEFAVYRIGSNSNTLELIEGHYSDEKKSISLYAIGIFRKAKKFPSFLNFDELANRAASNSDTLLGETIEIVKLLPFYNFQNNEEVKLLLSFLKNANLNIALQSAISLRDVSVSHNHIEMINSELKSILQSDTDNQLTKELLLTYKKFSNKNLKQLRDEFSLLDEKLFLPAAADDSSEFAKKFLLDSYNSSSLNNRIEIFPYLTNYELDDELVLDAMNSGSPALISLSADYLLNKDSGHPLELKQIILAIVNRYKNNGDYIESLASLYNLSKKIDSSFSTAILEIISSSEIYSNKKFALTGLGKSISHLYKEENMFEVLWSNAFKYKGAKLHTYKGIIEIDFYPDAAPISVGNFCYLAVQRFYNGIKFHRVVPGFVIQAGDPQGTGWGGPGYEIISEFSNLNYSPFIVGMASAGKDTEGSQFFITTGEYPHLNGRYSIFGIVTSGKEIASRISQWGEIIKVELIE